MRICVGVCATLALAGCSTLQNIHDPKFGFLSTPQVTGLLRSVKCEMMTFYAANAARKRKLDDIRTSYARRREFVLPFEMALAYRYFDLDTDAYGAYVLETKVVDTVGAPSSSSSVANVLRSATGRTETLTIGPNLNSQGTYDTNFNLAIQQDNDLSNIRTIAENQVTAFEAPASLDPHQGPCYHALVIEKYDELAAGQYPTLERFDRIAVNGNLPLAAWLQENATIAGVPRNILADSAPKDSHGKTRPAVPVAKVYQREATDGGQMSYIFTVQYTAGIDAKFSLVAAAWSPLAPAITASMVQTGVLSLYVNGHMATTALAAKGGAAIIAGRAGPPTPNQVFVVNGYENSKPGGIPAEYPPVIVKPGEAPGGPPPGGGPHKGAGAAAPKGLPLPPAGPNRGQLIAPISPFVLTPGP